MWVSRTQHGLGRLAYFFRLPVVHISSPGIESELSFDPRLCKARRRVGDVKLLGFACSMNVDLLAP
jgi:hypothetical protein